MLIECTNTLAKTRSLYRSVGLALAAICTCLWFSIAANAQMSASLRAFEGAWVGTGTLSHQNGVTERIRCRVDDVPRGPQTLQQTLRCQSDTTNFDIVSTVSEEAGRLAGHWTNEPQCARHFDRNHQRRRHQGHCSRTGLLGGDRDRCEGQ